MLLETHVALDCPYCKEAIYEPLSWFKKDYSTCPFCGQGLAAEQFSRTVSDLELAMEDHVEEMLNGRPQAGGGCCGSKKSSCCCGS